MKLAANLLVALVISVTPAAAQSLSCRFVSIDDLAGRERTSGTVVRTATAAIVEYDGGAWTQTYMCPYSIYSCEGERSGLRVDVDFSYPGYMISVTHAEAVGVTIIGLARLACE